MAGEGVVMMVLVLVVLGEEKADQSQRERFHGQRDDGDERMKGKSRRGFN